MTFQKLIQSALTKHLPLELFVPYAVVQTGQDTKVSVYGGKGAFGGIGEQPAPDLSQNGLWR